MALKWWQTSDIVQSEAQTTIRTAEATLDWLSEQERVRREQREAEALARRQKTGQQMYDYLKSVQRVSAADEITAANRQLAQLGFTDQIGISESTIQQQIMSGRSWANTLVKQAQAESRQDRIDEARKEAEARLLWNLAREGGNKHDYPYDEWEDMVSAETTNLLQQYYPDEYGVKEEVAPQLPASTPSEEAEVTPEAQPVSPYSDEQRTYVESQVEQLPAYTIEPEDVGLPGGGFDWKGKFFKRPNVELTFGVDWDKGDDIFVYHQDNVIGKLNAESGNLELEDPKYILESMTPSYWDRQHLKQTGQYPAEAPIRALMAVERWLDQPFEYVQGKVALTPRQILGGIGAVGAIAYTGYTGIQALQFFLSTSQTAGKAYAQITSTLTGKPKPPPAVASTVAEIKVYKEYQKTAIYRDWQAYVKQAKLSPSSAKYIGVDKELFKAFQYFKDGTAAGQRAAQSTIDQIRQSLRTMPGAVSLGRAVGPYTGAGKMPTPSVTPAPVTPTPAQAAPTTGAITTTPVSGVPTMITGQMETTLMGLGYTVQQIAGMTPQQAQNLLSKPEVTPIPETGKIIPKAEAVTPLEVGSPAELGLKQGERFTDDFGSDWVMAKSGEKSTAKFKLDTVVKGQRISIWARKEIGWQDKRADSLAKLQQLEAIPKAEVTGGIVPPEGARAEAGRLEIEQSLERIDKRIGELRESLKSRTGKRETKIWQNNELARYNEQKAGFERLLRENEPTELARYAPTTALAGGETVTGEIPEGVAIIDTTAMSTAEVRGIRQEVMAVGKVKGLSQTSLNKIFKEIVGRSPEDRQLPYRLTEMTDEQLRDTLEIVKTARPVRIGTKMVIRPSTERKIVSLKQSLINEGKLSEEAFGDMVNQLRLPTTRYETAKKFITEKEGNALIRMMNDEAEIGIIERQAKATKALNENPVVKASYDEYSKRITKGAQLYFEGKPADASVLKDMRFATEDLQVRTGKPFYNTYFGLNRAKNANHLYLEETKKRIIASTPEYNKMVNDKASMKRIRDYIAAKNAWAKVKSPENITPEEIKLAKAYEKELFALQPDFRYQRFVHHYHATEGNVAKMQEHIPDAPKEDLRKAVNIYESQGASGLKAYLDTRTWGIVGSGYEPHYVVSPKLAIRKLKATFPSGRLEPRSGVEFYPEDITIDKAVDRYVRQLRSYNLQPYARKLERLYGDSVSQLKNPYKVRRIISTMLNEMMGYKDRTFFGELIMKAASQAYITVFGTFLNLPFRNLFQNLAFHPDKSALIDPRNKKLTDWDWKFYETHVSQMKATEKDLLLGEEGGLPGFRRINRFILRLNIYGASDSKVNRVWSFWASLNKGQRALDGYKKDGNVGKFISNSGMSDLTLTQQKQVLENLVMEEVTVPGLPPSSGEHAAIAEIAAEIANNTHFLYDRSQRAWAEMGEMGRIIGSLVVFPRSVLQRTIIQAKVLDPKGYAPLPQKKRAMKVLLAMLFGSLGANYLYAKATGKTDAPYNPANILKWSPGGLAFGAVTTLTDVVGLVFRAAGGDENAITQLPGAVESAGDSFVPFYKMAMQTLEAAVDKKYIDRHFYREVRAAIERKLWEMGFLDKKEGDLYEPNDSFYEAERSWEWRIKHALFGTEPAESTPGKQAQKWQLNTLAQADYNCDWDDLTKDEKDDMYRRYPYLKE